MSTTRARPPDLMYIDSMRGLAALYVAACHAYLMYSPAILQQAADQVSRMLVLGTFWLAFGRVGVAIFIVISGYCLMLPVVRSENRRLNRTWFEFMGRRARRILPPYYGALALSIALIVLVPNLDDPAIGEWHKSFPALTAGAIGSHLLLLHNYFPPWQYAINHPMWSIATEWQIYFLFPSLAWVWVRFGVGKMLIASVAICVALLYFLILFWPGHDPWPPQFFALFGFGMAAAVHNHPTAGDARGPRVSSSSWGRRAVWLFALGAVSNLIFWSGRQQIPDFLVGAATAYSMLYLTHELQQGRRPRALRVLEWRPLVELGRFSYSLYLLHAPILALFFLGARELGLGMTSMQLFILSVGVPASVSVSYLFSMAFERPFTSARVSPRALPSVQPRTS